MGDPLMYTGLPAHGQRYCAMAYVLSSFFFGMNPVGYTLGGFIIPALALLNLLPIPYMTHRGGRRMQTHVKILVIGFLVTPAWRSLFARQYTFDVLFVFTFGYAAAAGFPSIRTRRRRFSRGTGNGRRSEREVGMSRAARRSVARGRAS
jgi:phosphatidylserine synthase